MMPTPFENEDIFWINDQIAVEWVDKEYLEKYCVDTTDTDPFYRYGKYTVREWIHIPKDQFPPEFLVQLMLLGIE